MTRKRSLPLLAYVALLPGAVAQSASSWKYPNQVNNVICWGHNSKHQSVVPADVEPAKLLAVGYTATCTVNVKGKVNCWGDGLTRQVGSWIPTDLPPIGRITMGWKQVCILSEVDRNLTCWGSGDSIPEPAGLTRVRDICSGRRHNCAHLESGEVICFGFTNNNRLDVPTGMNVEKLVCGADHTCVIEVGGNLICWGYNNKNQADVPPNLGPVKDVGLGASFTCAVQSPSGHMVCWGQDYLNVVTAPMVSGLRFKSVTAGQFNACGMLEDDVDASALDDDNPVTVSGRLACWGDYESYKQKTGHFGRLDGVALSVQGWNNHCILDGWPVVGPTTTVTTSQTWTSTSSTSTATTTVTSTTTQSSTSTATETTSTSETTSTTTATASSTTSSTLTATTTTSSTLSTTASSTSTASSTTTTSSTATTTSTSTATSTETTTSTATTTTMTSTLSSTSTSTGTSTTTVTVTKTTMTTKTKSTTTTTTKTTTSTTSTETETTGTSTSTRTTTKTTTSTTTKTTTSTTSTETETTGTSTTTETTTRTTTTTTTSETSTTSTTSRTRTRTTTLTSLTTTSTRSSTTKTSTFTSTTSSRTSTTLSTTTTTTVLAVRFGYDLVGVDCAAIEGTPALSNALIAASEEALAMSFNTSGHGGIREHFQTSLACKDAEAKQTRRLAAVQEQVLGVETVVRTDLAAVPASDAMAALQFAVETGQWKETLEKAVWDIAGIADVTLPGTKATVGDVPKLAMLWDTRVIPLDLAPIPQVRAVLAAVEDGKPTVLEILKRKEKDQELQGLATGGLLFGATLVRSVLPTENASNLAEGETPASILDVPIGTQHGDGKLQVLLPPSLFTDVLDPLNEEVALLAHAASPRLARAMGSNPPEVRAAAVIDLNALSGPAVPVNGLRDPILLQLPVVFDTNAMECAYWINESATWSTEGVAVSKRTKLGGPLWCETTHLSFFAAIVQGIIDTLLCTNFGIFNLEAITALAAGQWWRASGTVVYWCILLVLLLAMAVAAHLDWQRRKSYGWRDEFFLVPPLSVRAAEEPEEAPPEEEPQVARERSVVARYKGAISGMLCGAVSCCLDSLSGPLRDALDDIASEWFEFFGEVRGFCETVHGEIGGEGGLMGMAGKAMLRLVLLASRRKTAAAMGISGDLVSFVLEDEMLARFITAEAVNLPPAQASDVWWTCTEQKLLWRRLRDEVCKQSLQHVTEQKHHKLKIFLDSVTALFTRQNPLGSLFVVDVFQSSKQRVMTLAAELQGSFVLTCVFFEASGSVRGKKVKGQGDCGGDDDGSLGLKLGRFIVIVTGSLLLAGVPVVILSSCQTTGFKEIEGGPDSPAYQRQLRVWRIQTRLFWILGAVYNCFCSFYVLLFLANIGDEDQLEWCVAGVMAFAQDFLLLPLVIALLIPMMAKACLTVQSLVTKVPISHLVRRACEELHETSNVMLPIELL